MDYLLQHQKVVRPMWQFSMRTKLSISIITRMELSSYKKKQC